MAGGDSPDFGAQAEVMGAMTDMLKEQQSHIQGVNQALGEQIGLMQKLCELNAQCQDTDKKTEFNQLIEDGQDQIRQTTDETSRLTEEMKRQTDEQERSGGMIEKLKAGFSGLAGEANASKAAAGALTGALAGVAAGAQAAAAGFGVITGAASGLIGAVSGTMKALWGWAQSGGGGGGGWREALDGVREEFGRLESGEGAAVMEMYEGIRDTQSDLAAGGTRLKAVIGKKADVLKYATEMAKSMGGQFGALKGQLSEAAGEMMMLNKGMNLSNEAMKTMAINAKASGQSMKESATETAQMTVGMAKSMGVSAKAVGKNMSELGKDFETFGHMSQKQMVATAGYADALGVSIKSLKGMMDKFDSFEGAAESAGKLNEVMGMNVDTMAMMNAESPAERMDMLRKSFEDTGKSVGDLTRHELKAMADAAGTTAEDLKMALSTSTEDVSFDEFAEAAEQAKEDVSPAEAMQELAKEMKKFTKGGGGGGAQGGPLAQFIAGMKKGIMMSPKFRKLRKTIKKFLKTFFKGGKKVGAIIGRIMGKAGGLMDAFTALFDNKIVKTFMKSIEKAFLIFEKALGRNVPFAEAFTELLTNLWGSVAEYWKDLKPKLQELWTKIKDFLYKALVALGDLLPKLVSKIASGLTNLAKWITEAFAKKTKKEAEGKGGNRFVKALSDAWKKLMPVLQNELWPALKELFKALFVNLGPWVLKFLAIYVLWQMKGAILSWGYSTFLGPVVAKLKGYISKGFTKILGKGVQTGAKSAGKGIGKFFAKHGASILGKTAVVAAVAMVAMDASKEYERLGPMMEEKMGKQEAHIAAGAASVLDALTLGLMPDSVIEDFGFFIGDLLGNVEKIMNKLGLGQVFEVWKKQLSGFLNIFLGLGDMLRGFFMIFQGKEGGFELVRKGVDKILTGIVDLIKAKIQWAIAAIPQLFVLAGKIVLTGLGFILKSVFIYLPKAALWLITKLGEMLTVIFTFAVDFISDPKYRAKIIKGITDTALNALKSAKDTLLGFATWIYDWAKGLIFEFLMAWGITGGNSKEAESMAGNVVDSLIKTFFDIIDGITAIAVGAWDMVVWAFSGAYDWIVGVITTIVDVFWTIVDTIKAIALKAWEIYTLPFRLAFTFFSGIIETIVTVFSAIPEKIKAIATLAWDFLTGAISPSKALEAGSNIVKGILDGVANLKDKMFEKAEAAWESVKSAFSIFSPSKKAVEAGSQITAGMTAGLEPMKQEMAQVAADAMKMMKSAMVESVNMIIDVFVGIMQEVGRVFRELGAILKPAVIEALAIVPEAAKEALVQTYEMVKSFGDAVGDLFDSFVAYWTAPLQGLAVAIKQAFVAAYQVVASVGPALVDAIVSTATALTKFLTAWAAGPLYNALWDVGFEFHWFARGITDTYMRMLDTMVRITANVFAPAMANTMMNVTKDILQVIAMVTVGGIGIMKGILNKIVSPQIEKAPALSGVAESLQEVTAIAIGTRSVMEDILGQVDEAIEAIAVTQRIMSGDVKLKAVNAVLTGKKKVVVETKAMHVQLDVTVVMDSKRIGKALDVASHGKPWYPKPTYRGGSSIENSDIRLKNNIKKLGKSKSGINVYTFSYKNDPESKQYIGVMAQELLRRVPEAVVLNNDGYYAVDYSRIDVDFQEVKQ